MIKIEAVSLEKAYEQAASALQCSVTELETEVVQLPRKGYFGLFQKNAIIVAVAQKKESVVAEETPQESVSQNKIEDRVETKEEIQEPEESPVVENEKTEHKNRLQKLTDNKITQTLKVKKVKSAFHKIMPVSLTNEQELQDEKELETQEDSSHIEAIAQEIETEINKLYDLTCFNIEKIAVSAYDKETVLVEFNGEDAALLIGKEGYRYKAISYMLFNWINSKYKVQLRLEIAEFLKNQEESVARYIETVCESIDSDGKAQTKVLDGVLVQIALTELRERYPEKYVVIRSTKDGQKYIIVNDYHSS